METRCMRDLSWMRGISNGVEESARAVKDGLERRASIVNAVRFAGLFLTAKVAGAIASIS